MVIASAHLMAVLDTTVMFVALPSLQPSLGMSVTSRQWVVTVYTLALAGFLLIGGRLADRLGARRTYPLGEAASASWSSAPIICSLAVAAVMLTVFAARQAGHTDRLLPLRVVLDRNRGWAMIGLIVNGLSTFGMLLILTYQLRSVMGYSALETRLALIPFTLAALPTAALLTPFLMVRIPPRWLITAAIALEAAGLVPLLWLTPHSGYLPLVLVASVIEGFGTGIATPATLNTALAGVLVSDSGAAGAATSAASQLGSSVGAALLNTIAVSATASYLALHPTAGAVTGTVHGFTVAIIWGAAITFAGAIPIAVFVNAKTPARPS